MDTEAQLPSFYAHLSDLQRETSIRWFRLSNDLGLSSAECMNLYDATFDKPEIHMVREGKAIGNQAERAPKLKFHYFARRAFATFHVKRRTRADARPEPASGLSIRPSIHFV